MPTLARPLPSSAPNAGALRAVRDLVERALPGRSRVVAAVLALAGLLALALAKSGPLVDALHRALSADWRWVAGAAGLELLSIAGYVLLLHHVVIRPTPGLGWRHSYALSVGGTAASRLLPTAGLGGVALSLLVLRRAGLRTAAAAERLLAFLVLLYAVFLGALVVLGAALATGALPSDGPRIVAGAAALGAAALGAAARAPTCAARSSRCSARPHGGASTSRSCGRCSTRSAPRPRSGWCCSHTSWAAWPTWCRCRARSAAG